MARIFHKNWYAKSSAAISVIGSTEDILNICKTYCIDLNATMNDVITPSIGRHEFYIVQKEHYIMLDDNEKPNISIVHVENRQAIYEYIEYVFMHELCLDIIEKTVMHNLSDTHGIQVETSYKVLAEKSYLDIIRITYQADTQLPRIKAKLSWLYIVWEQIIKELIILVLSEYEMMIKHNLNYRKDKWDIKNAIDNFIFNKPIYSEEMEKIHH